MTHLTNNTAALPGLKARPLPEGMRAWVSTHLSLPSLWEGRASARGGLVRFMFFRDPGTLHPRACALTFFQLIWNSQYVGNRSANRLGIRFDVIIRESDHCPAELLQVLLTAKVIGNCLVVVSAIDFDNKHSFDTSKVSNPWSDSVLTTKF